MAYEALGSIGLWLQTLSGTGTVPLIEKSNTHPSHTFWMEEMGLILRISKNTQRIKLISCYFINNNTHYLCF